MLEDTSSFLWRVQGFFPWFLPVTRQVNVHRTLKEFARNEGDDAMSSHRCNAISCDLSLWWQGRIHVGTVAYDAPKNFGMSFCGQSMSYFVIDGSTNSGCPSGLFIFKKVHKVLTYVKFICLNLSNNLVKDHWRMILHLRYSPAPSILSCSTCGGIFTILDLF